MRHRVSLSTVTALLIVTSIPADARPSTLSMTCGEARNLVARSGAVVLSTGQFTYDRFVASARFCALGEYAYTGTAPTRDSPACVVGYVCKAAPPLWDDGFGHRGGFFH